MFLLTTTTTTTKERGNKCPIR